MRNEVLCKICKIRRGKIKDNTKSGGDLLKELRHKCEDCGFSIPIPGDILKSRRLECPGCGSIYRALVTSNTYRFKKFHKNNK